MKILCILWDISGVIALLRVIADSRGDEAVIVGALIGFALLCVLPTYFCIRGKKPNSKDVNVDKQTTTLSSNYQQPIIHQQLVITANVTNPKTLQTQMSILNNSQRPNLIGREYKHELYYDRLKRLCNPANFVVNYDKEKVDIANGIYAKILSTNKNDGKAIHELCVETEQKLGINLLDEDDFETLRDNLNPKNYVKPYDSEKIALANELYSEFLEGIVNYTKFVCIKMKANPLLMYLKNQREKRRRKKQEEEDACIISLSVILASILVCLIFGSINHSKERQTEANRQVVSVGQSSTSGPFHYDYPEYGFSITAPCILEDVPAQAKGKNLVSVGGFVNKGNRQNFTFYQLIVSEIRNKTEAEVLEFMKNRQGGMSNLRQIKISGCNSIEGDAVTQGVNTKGAFIIKSPYLISLTVISPINLEQKYDDFKNSFKIIVEPLSLIENE